MTAPIQPTGPGAAARPARTLTCVDLDRTVIYSTNALALSMPDHRAPRLLCVEVYRQLPLSFITERAAALLAELAAATTLVPVTTRTPEQFTRVQLPIPAGTGDRPQYAVASNGGHVLVNGEPDTDWSYRVGKALAACAPLKDLHRYLQRVSHDGYVDTVRVAGDLFCYAVVQRDKLPIGWVEDLTGHADAHGWRVSVQGRKVYLVPIPLTKSAAIEEIQRRTGAGTVVAAGDSLLDVDMLECADLGVRPAAGELASSGWSAGHIAVITTPGVVGGERLLEWLLSRAGGATG